MREGDVGHQAPAKERADTAAGPVDELIRYDDVERFVFLLQTAYSAGGQDVLHTKLLHAKNVGAEIQLGRRETMSGAVARKECHSLAAQCANDIGR